MNPNPAEFSTVVVDDDKKVISFLRMMGVDHNRLEETARKSKPGCAVLTVRNIGFEWTIVYFRGFPDKKDNGYHAIGFSEFLHNAAELAQRRKVAIEMLGLSRITTGFLTPNPNIGVSE